MPKERDLVCVPCVLAVVRHCGVTAAMGKKAAQPKPPTAAKSRTSKKRPASPAVTSPAVAARRKLAKTPTSPRTPPGRRELGVFAKPSANQLASFFHVDVNTILNQPNMGEPERAANEGDATLSPPQVGVAQTQDVAAVVDATGACHSIEPKACASGDAPSRADCAKQSGDPTAEANACEDTQIQQDAPPPSELSRAVGLAESADTDNSCSQSMVPEAVENVSDAVVVLDQCTEQPPAPASQCDVKPTTHEQAPVESNADAETERLERLSSTLFNWPSSMVKTVAQIAGGNSSDVAEYAEYMRTILCSLSISTSFSGIDAPSTALAMLSTGVLQHSGRAVTAQEMPKTRNTWSVEWVASAQQELMHHPFGPRCVFGDINSFWLRSIAEKADSICGQRQTMAMLRELVMSTTCTGRTAYCSSCQRQCTITESDIHIGGTPCTDFSPRGDRDQLSGKTTMALLSWASMRRDVQEPYWVQENVPAFPESVLQELLSDLYEIQSCVLDPAGLGWPVTRRRQYIVGRHKTKAPLQFQRNLRSFVSQFSCGPKCEGDASIPAWDVFFAASSRELQAEKQWAAGRPTSLAQKAGTPAHEADFETCLTEMEQSFRSKYEALCPGVCYSLCQNPAVSATHSTWRHLHTILKSAGTIWSDYHSRWLTAGEALMAQGFPVDVRLSHNIPMTSFSTPDRDERSVASRTARIGFAGNTMHVECVALVLLYILTHGAMPLSKIQSAGVSRNLCRRMRLPNMLSKSLLSIAGMVARPN